jgi:ubiquinone/menaquinone biosynthesis C-methylase UbiE
VSAWLARRGARPAGLDNSAAQLATAARLQAEFGLQYPLVHASAERTPFADATFDLAISESVATYISLIIAAGCGLRLQFGASPLHTK